MSTFEDIETQNARRWRNVDPSHPSLDFRGIMTMTPGEHLIALGCHVRDAFNRHVLICGEGPGPDRVARTALPLLGPWAPPSGRWEPGAARGSMLGNASGEWLGLIRHHVRTFQISTPDGRTVDVGARREP